DQPHRREEQLPMSTHKFTRREALGLVGAGAVVAGTKVLSGQAPAGRLVATRTAPPAVDELTNVQQFEEQAKLALPQASYAAVEGGDREPFNLMSFRPRMNVPVLEMNLDVPMLGQTLFTPIVVGPVSDLNRYHRDGELEMVRGA